MAGLARGGRGRRALAERSCCVAMHPNDAARLGDRLTAALAEIDALAGTRGSAGWGRPGWTTTAPATTAGQARQRESFAAHIGLATAHGKTLVIHDRDAHADILDVLDAEGPPDRFVMHCFSGDAAFARECLDRGACLSFAGTVTFKHERGLREAFAGRPARPAARRDRRALPDPDAAAGPAQRVLPDPAHRPIPWPRAAATTSPRSAGRWTTTPTAAFGGPW